MNFKKWAIIKKITNEYKEGDRAIIICTVFFCNIPVYITINTTTNNQIVRSLTIINNNTTIKGFNNENEN